MSTHKGSDTGWVVAIAIEDKLELRASRYGNGSSTSEATASFQVAEELQTDPDYLTSVVGLLRRFLSTLIEERFGSSAMEFVESVRSVVISTPGVVDKNRFLLQLPLWRGSARDALPRQGRISVGGRQKLEDTFDFRREISSLVGDLLKQCDASWKKNAQALFELAIFVVNDATACAALEYEYRRGVVDHPEDFVLLKIHNGINVGFVQRDGLGEPAVKTSHAEAGHGYPRLHADDCRIKFEGVCEYHHACFQGMIASHSLFARATRKDNRPFVAWKTYLDGRRGSGGQANANAEQIDLASYLLGHDGMTPPSRSLPAGPFLLNRLLAALVPSLSPRSAQTYPLPRRQGTRTWLARSHG